MDTTDATRTYTIREKVVKLLLERGADVDARNNVGKTVLQVAVEQCNFGNIERILLSRPAVNGKGNEHCLRIALESAGLEYGGIVDYGFTLKGRDAKDPRLLHVAVRNGHTKIIDLLKPGADVEAKHEIANASIGTLLHSAAASRRIRIAELLLERGADINAKDTNYKTPIVYAVENMDPNMTKLFLTNGANCEGKSSLIHAAAERGCSHIMEMILEKIPSIDVNAVDNDLRPRSAKVVNFMFTVGTALHVAVAGGFARVVDILLDHKANVGSFAKKIGTPLHCSALQRDETIDEMLLLKGAEVDAMREDGTTALHLAVRESNVRAFNVLIKHGADVHKRNKKGLNLVHMATEHEHLKIFEEDLLDVFEAGHPKTNDGLTALHMAVRMDSLENVEILLRHGADASVAGKNGVTPLHDAASCDRERRVIEALNSLDNVDTTHVNGYIALHSAAIEGNLTAFRLLIFHGCDINVKNKNGRTPLDVIKWNKKRQLATIIEERIVKMMVLGLYVDPFNTCWIGSLHPNSRTYDRCEKEIESMKGTKIGESKVSFYEFLTANKRQLAFFSRNQSITEVLERGDHMDTFKLYCDMIDWRFRRTKIINDLVDSSARSLSALSGYSLSDYDYMKIFGYLDRRDLENVIRAGTRDEKSKKRDLEFVSRLLKKKIIRKSLTLYYL